MATMKASVLRAAKTIAVEEVDVPEIASDQVLVRVEAVGVCGSDVHYFNEMRIGDFVVEAP